MTDDLTPLEQLNLAVQSFANEQADEAIVVHSALVVWEQVRYDEQGRPVRSLHYSLPSDGASLAGSLGLAAAADQMLRRDAIGSGDDE